MTTDWNAIRAEFPALAKWTYLNTATYGQLPRRASEANTRHFAGRDELACTDFLAWYDEADCFRESVARLINAAPGDIAFIPNAATALSLIAGGIDWKPGDNLVTLADEFPSQLYLPALVERYGVEFREVPWGSDGSKFRASIDSLTRLIAISHVNYSTGFRAPIEEISKAARSFGARVFVDGTQSAGVLHIDVRRLQPDMFAVHGYKWMCSPTGAGFMYVSPDLRAILPPSTVGWRSHHDWRNVDDLHHGSPVLGDSAQRYEGGGLPFGLLHAMAASVEWMLEIGPEAIEQRVLALAASARDRLRGLGAEVLDHGSSQIVAAKFPDNSPHRDPSRLARELKARRVVVAARHGFLRVSPHFYNNESDLDRLETELRDLIR
jgi:cysteine desulfurase/selenocysteine lyase